MECLKLITRPGCEKIVRYAFEYARRHSRKKVTCFTKDNIMKMTDGLFHKVFDEIAAEYPDIENEHWIVDIGAAKLADTPGAFDVIVMPNLYGDILSDVAAQIAGSVGLAGSANIGDQCAMFEAIHGSAPRRAGQNLANPSGLLLGGVMMLVHIGQPEIAERVHNAWLRTIEDGIHTYDIFKRASASRRSARRNSRSAVVGAAGQEAQDAEAGRLRRRAARARKRRGQAVSRPDPKVDLVGVDVYVNWPSLDNDKLAAVLQQNGRRTRMALTMMSNRGVKTWPGGHPETFCTDNFRCRFAPTGRDVTQAQIIGLLEPIAATGMEIVKTENLRNYDGQARLHAGAGAITMSCSRWLPSSWAASPTGRRCAMPTKRSRKFGVPHECRVISAHRTPQLARAVRGGSGVARHRSDHRGRRAARRIWPA